MKNKAFIKLCPLFALALTSCGKTYEVKDYMIELNWKDNYRILQLNDIHIGNKDDLDLQFKYLKSVIEDENVNADLIVLNGDLFTFANRATAKRLFSFMDERKVNWTVTFGNHDEQAYFSIDWLTGYLNKLNDKRASGDSYCVFKDLQDDDIMGNGNFVINLSHIIKKFWIHFLWIRFIIQLPQLILSTNISNIISIKHILYLIITNTGKDSC